MTIIPSRETLSVYSIVGVFFVTILGTIFHFLFESSGRNTVLASIVPVNESTWEHLKLLVFPYLLYMLIVRASISGCINNFIPGITLGIYSGSAFIVFAFYTYIGALTREHDLTIDILIFILGVILAFIVSYLVFTASPVSNTLNLIAFVALLFYIFILILFTYSPIEIPLLQDPITGGYGIVPPLKEEDTLPFTGPP